MDYSKFVEKAVLKDKRNIFSRYDGSLDIIPDDLKEFYKKSNPLDVEINAVKFLPAEELIALQREYSYLSAQFVFATCNGDPIFLNDGCIYTCPHGVKNAQWELLSDNIMSYLESLF